MANGLLQTYGYGAKPGDELSFTGTDITGMPISLVEEMPVSQPTMPTALVEEMPVSQPTMPSEPVSSQSPSLGSRAMGILGSIGSALGDIGGAAGRGLMNLGGGVQQFFQDRPDLLDTLSIGFGGMSMRPNEGLIDLAKARIAQREVNRQQQAALNRTAEYLKTQGYDDLAQLAMTTGDASLALAEFEKRKAGPSPEVISSLRKEFADRQVVKDFTAVGIAYQKIANTPETAAGDLALVFNYMKMLDPASVVRESEFKNAAQARAWLGNMDEENRLVPNNVRAAIKKAEEGTILLDDQREDFRNTAKGIYLGAQKQYNDAADFYRTYAKYLNIDPSYIIQEYQFGAPANKAQIISVTPSERG